MSRFPNIIIASILATVLSASSFAANFGWTFTYQGKLDQSGAPVSGSTPMTFRLFAQATGGSALAIPIAQSVNVTDGLFTVNLDFTNGGTIAGVFDGADRWLEIEVNGTVLTPRQQLRATPHAAVASLFQVPLALDTMSPSIMHLKTHADVAQVRALLVENYSSQIGAISIMGIHNEDANEGVGVAGISYSSNGFGVTGSNESPTGNNTGIYGNSISPQGTGVSGFAFAAAGGNKGVWGSTNSPQGWAGYFTGRGYFSDNVGIGTTTPSALLHVVRASGDSTDPLRITTTSGAPLTISSNMTLTGSTINTSSTFGASALSLNSTATGNVILAAGGGNVGIGDTTPSFQLQLSENSAAKPTSGSWTVSSDARLKKNIEPIDDALDRLMQLHGVTYQWIDPASQGDMAGTYTGMIAQDVEKVFPEWIGADAKGFQTLTVIGFEGLAVEALRDLRAEKDAQIATLQAQVDDLKSQLDELKSLVAQLATQSGK